MSSEHAKKRQRRSPEESDNVMVSMEALLDQRLSQMEQKMQSKIDSMQSEMDSMTDRLSRVVELEERCKYLEDDCESMGRSLRVLARRWEFSAPDIPDRYWIERGFDEDYAADMVDPFVQDINCVIGRLKEGRIDIPALGYNDDDDTGRVLLHDDALLRYWKNLADAFDLCGPSKVGGTLLVSDIQLAPKVLALLTPPLAAVKKFTEIRLFRNDFPRACDGVKFAVELIQSSPYLETFQWVGNPLDTIDDSNCLVSAIKSNPSIRHVRLEGCCDVDNVDMGYHLLSSLITETSALATLDLDSNNIRTLGGTHLSDYLTTNPPLEELFLNRNKLDDNDATLIADALKRNTNLTGLSLARNEITEIGRNALANVIHDQSSLNSAADSNHTCTIYGVFGANVGGRNGVDNRQDPRTNRGRKIYNLLSSRNKEEANVHHLNLEFGDDDSLKFVPRVLESVHNYARHRFNERSHNEVPPLSIFYELLRGWKMPSLYEHGKVQTAATVV